MMEERIQMEQGRIGWQQQRRKFEKGMKIIHAKKYLTCNVKQNRLDMGFLINKKIRQIGIEFKPVTDGICNSQN